MLFPLGETELVVLEVSLFDFFLGKAPQLRELVAAMGERDFIVAGGIGENQVEALLAGMACGLKPVIHNFPGADKLFPRPHLFNIAEQFCEQVLSPQYEPESYRRFVEECFPVREQLKKVDGILTQLETEIDVQRPSPCGCQVGVDSR